jgi:hypothetical protein
MTVINVLYLPRDDRFRSIVRTALEFVEEVYKPEFLSGARFVSFNRDDDFDVEQATRIAINYRFPSVVERNGHISPRFYLPHSHTRLGYSWVPLYKGQRLIKIFEYVVHELTHIALKRLPSGYMEVIVNAFAMDVNIGDIAMKYKGREILLAATETAELIEEATVMYIFTNYFVNLRRDPSTPAQAVIWDYMKRKLSVLEPLPHVRDLVKRILWDLYFSLAGKDLAPFRSAIHEAFKAMAKRFPADVYEPNKAKYEILYREQSI